ncbi:MAG: hypothetical protein HGA19_20105 [Oscillochloris sp.]|nr:hypothetical protein [Oscillochloris sp.]
MSSNSYVADTQLVSCKPDASKEPDLVGIVADALQIQPPNYLASVLGYPKTWVPPHDRYSEFRMLDVWRPLHSLYYLSNVILPTIPLPPPTIGVPLINTLFWRPSVILQRPDHNGSYTSYPDEAWFFINGIMTNDAVAQLNAAYLSYLFHRPIALLQNTTCGMFADLIECALGKQWHRMTEAAVQAFPPIYDALKSHRQRVVLIAHSQGTIIAAIILQQFIELAKFMSRSDVLGGARDADQPCAGPVFVYPDQSPFRLSDFEPLSEPEWAKLEIYCFANCATTMTYYQRPSLPWIEHFGNEYDIVSRLGMLAPNAEARGIHIDGPRYEHRGAWGHLLNEHYLHDIEAIQKNGRKRGGCGGCAPYTMRNSDSFPEDMVPRLFSYLNGGSPLA